MSTYLLPVVVALCVAWASYYAPLPLPAPYQDLKMPLDMPFGNLMPLEGPLTQNRLLEEGENLFQDRIRSPETVVFDGEGRMYLFAEDGIYRAEPKGDTFHDPKLFVEVEGGRPLSGAFDSNDDLYFCDTILGLGKVDVESRTYNIVLTDRVLYFCDDLVINSEDEIFVADATSLRVPSPGQVLATSYIAVASGLRYGRVLKYTPLTGAVETLMPNMSFANGVSLSHNEDYLLVSEGGSTFRILRHWLKGPKRGTTDTFMDALPGYSDGISQGSESTFWIAIFARVDRLQSVLLRYRILRWAGLQLPVSIQEALIHSHDIVIQADSQGNVLRSFHDPSSPARRTTSIVERKGRIYVGNFAPHVKVVDLRKPTTT